MVLARETRCFSPPESLTPRSPTTVLYPVANIQSHGRLSAVSSVKISPKLTFREAHDTVVQSSGFSGFSDFLVSAAFTAVADVLFCERERTSDR